MWLLYRPPARPVLCESIHDLPADPVGVIGIWLVGEGQDVAPELVDIRRSIAHAHLPVFIERSLPDADLAALHDGLAVSLAEALSRALEWRPLCDSLQGRSESPPVALLRYLYLRPFAPLMPVRDASSPAVYRFPLVEALVPCEPAASLIARLVGDGWLQAVSLLDRLRRCRFCASAHLNYVDVCPRCRSLDIKVVEFLHCFSCSHVAMAEAFADGASLSCPNCRERLHHIGVDYHRTLERMICEGCSESFEEALVTVRCLECGAGQSPESLPVHAICSYVLTAQAHAVARKGRMPESLAGAPGDTSLAPALYLRLLEWMRGLSDRDGGFSFALIGLHVMPERAAEEWPDDILDVYEDRLQEQLRATDLVIRSCVDVFWLALPNATPGGAQSVLHRMVEPDGEIAMRKAGLRVRGAVYGPEQFREAGSMARQLERLTEAIRGRVSC